MDPGIDSVHLVHQRLEQLHGKKCVVIIHFELFVNSLVFSLPQGEPVHTCAEDLKYCPTPEDLASITQLSFWAEGAAGDFKIDLQTIGAANL